MKVQKYFVSIAPFWASLLYLLQQLIDRNITTYLLSSFFSLLTINNLKSSLCRTIRGSSLRLTFSVSSQESIVDLTPGYGYFDRVITLKDIFDAG